MKFAYTALTKDNKKITGVLESENQTAAQEELHKMGVAILAVNEISDADYERLRQEQEAKRAEKGIQTFAFIALDPNGKEIEGTIDSPDNYGAYKRLRTEYQFTLKELYPADASETVRETAKGTLEGLEARLGQEKVETTAQEDKAREEGLSEGEDAINKEIVGEVDKVVINTKKALEEHQDIYSNDLIQEIQNTLGELERIRTSNNIKHITEVSNDLYSLISNPDKMEGELSETHQQLMEEIKDSALVRREFELYKKAVEVTGVKKIFKSITERFKKMTETSEEEDQKPNLITRLKKSIHKKLDKFSFKKPPKIQKIKKEKGRISLLLEQVGTYFKTSNPVLRKTRQRELMKSLKNLFKSKSKEVVSEEMVSEEKPTPLPAETMKKKEGRQRDFTPLFVEIDSFTGWLLCFYMIYFFLVSFSLEKNIGLSREFVFKTLKTPLLLNITIFLLLLHFSLRIKNLHLQKNAVATFFLVAFTLGLYTLLIINF